MRQTMTFDNGGEFARHGFLKDAFDMATYFCDAYASWQKGSIENMNGRIRRWLEDGMYVMEEKLADPAFADKMVRFVRASMKGWEYAEAMCGQPFCFEQRFYIRIKACPCGGSRGCCNLAI